MSVPEHDVRGLAEASERCAKAARQLRGAYTAVLALALGLIFATLIISIAEPEPTVVAGFAAVGTQFSLLALVFVLMGLRQVLLSLAQLARGAADPSGTTDPVS